MEHSIFLAKVIGLYLLIVPAAVLFRRKQFAKITNELVANLSGSSGFLVDVRPTPAPSCSFCGTGIDHCAL